MRFLRTSLRPGRPGQQDGALAAGKAQHAARAEAEPTVESQRAVVVDAYCQLQPFGPGVGGQSPQHAYQGRAQTLTAQLAGDNQIGYFGNGVTIADNLSAGDGTRRLAGMGEYVQEPARLLQAKRTFVAGGEIAKRLRGEAAGMQRRQIGDCSKAETNRQRQWSRRLEEFWSRGWRKDQAGWGRSKNGRLDETISQEGISSVRSGGCGRARSWLRIGP